MGQAVIIGIIGFLTSFLLEYLSIYITKKKCKVHELNIDISKLKLRYKVILYITNSGLWFCIGWQTEDIYLAILISLLISLAIMISLVDLRIHIIPNEFVLAMIIIGVLLQVKYLSLQIFLTAIGCMIGTAALFLVVALLTGMHKVGAGDVKLAGAMGFALGYPDILTALMVMGAVMLIYCFTGFTFYKISMKSALPLAPFLMIGMTAGLLENIVG